MEAGLGDELGRRGREIGGRRAGGKRDQSKWVGLARRGGAGLARGEGFGDTGLVRGAGLGRE